MTNNLVLVVIAVVLAVIGGYLIGGQLERDRQHRRRRAAARQGVAPVVAVGETLSDTEWERFVVSIYELADGGEW
jgi:hypothetical protein